MLRKISTGCETVDKILGGGLPFESLSLVYGEAETGKTTLAMQCAVSCAEQGYKTLFIDCDGTFSARRFSQLASKNFEKIAELVILMKPSSFKEQTLVIDQLENYVTKGFGLIVVDTITSSYRVNIAETPEKTFQLNRELSRQTALLAQIAKTQKIAVLMTSQVRSVFNETYVSVEPVATRVLRFWADTIIAMKPTENPKAIKAVVEKIPKNVKTTQRLTCHLKIGKAGIQDYSTS